MTQLSPRTAVCSKRESARTRAALIGLFAAAALLAALTATGCSGTPAATPPTTSAPAEVTPPPATTPPATPAPATKPLPTVSALQIKDLKVGKGAVAKAGQTVTVNYTGWLMDGTKFDSSLDSGQPFTFRLGAGQVIPGWDKGVAGMKVGGRRVLVIPGAMAYGEQGSPPVIPANATLKFQVDLLSVK